MKAKERANALVAKLQAELKGPYDEERAKLSAELKALVATAHEAEAPIRARLKELNDIIKPIDDKILDISQAGKLRNQEQANKLIDDLEASL